MDAGQVKQNPAGVHFTLLTSGGQNLAALELQVCVFFSLGDKMIFLLWFVEDAETMRPAYKYLWISVNCWEPYELNAKPFYLLVIVKVCVF